MKSWFSKKKQKGIAERKTEEKRKNNLPYSTMGLVVLLWIVVSRMFFGHGIMPHTEIAEGQRTPSTIVASVDFECENLTETAFNRSKAADAVPPVFTIDPAPTRRASKLVSALFDRLENHAVASTNQQPFVLSSINDILIGTGVSAADLVAAFPTNTLATTKSALVEGINEMMGVGVLSDEYRTTLFRLAPDRQLTIAATAETSARTVRQHDIHSSRNVVSALSNAAETESQRDLLDLLLRSIITDNLNYDEVTTDTLRRQASSAVPPVMKEYPAGTVLVRAGEPATQQTLLLLQEHAQKRLEDQELFEQAMEILGNSILLLAGLIATIVILRIGNPRLTTQVDKLLLMAILSLLTLGMARLMVYLSVQYTLISPALLVYLVPYALAVLLAGILLGGTAAISLGFWTSFATAVLFEQSFNVFALGILITITAASTARNVHRRSSLFRAGLWVCAVKMLYVLIVAILNRPVMAVLVGQICAAILSGMLSTVLTLLLIPVFEKLFKITTEITLLELSDMGHPLLQKMAIQAPGTYHHSLMVATLAQNAAEAIGANSLLVRVCAYYHDIGKMAKPEFFTENIQHQENPHDELSPHMSALVITSHVKEGLTLAKRHKLPKPIFDAIEQHHGNGIISYFYHKAKTQQEEGAEDKVNDSDFRYGGAPAITPEMAILSLADASEAASRSIEKPTPQKIANMINDIFETKIRDGQMDYAELTMAQINIVKRSIIFSLTNMLHGRIPYPKDHENHTAQPTTKASPPTEKTPTAD